MIREPARKITSVKNNNKIKNPHHFVHQQCGRRVCVQVNVLEIQAIFGVAKVQLKKSFFIHSINFQFSNSLSKVFLVFHSYFFIHITHVDNIHNENLILEL